MTTAWPCASSRAGTVTRARSALRSLPLAVVAASLAVAACTSSAPHASFDEPWVRFMANAQIAGAFDSSRLARRADTTDVWLRFQYAEPQPSPSDSSDRFTSMETRMEIVCPKRRVRDGRMLVRDSAGDSINGYTPPAPEWQLFTMHPIRSATLDEVCEGVGTLERR